MELTVAGGNPAAPALPVANQGPAPYQGPAPSEPPTGVMQSAVAQSGSPQQWPEQQWPPQPIPPQTWPQPVPPQQAWPQSVAPQQWSQPGPPQQWESAGATSAAWAAAPAVTPAPAVSVPKRRSARARAVDLVFGLSMLVAVGGVAFALGRATAPPSTASNAALAGLGNFPNRSNPNAVVPPVASSAPVVQQQVAPSGAPVLPATGTGTGTPTTPQGGPQGGPPVFGRGGLTGIVSALGDGSVTFTTADGQPTEVTTTDSTTYHQQAAATVADVTLGSSVRITPAGGFGSGAGLSASDVEILLPTQGDGTSTTGAADQGRGFGRGGLTGTVAAVGDGSISLSTAAGQTIDIATTPTTTYHQQAAATAADVVVGSSIRITAAGGFGGPGAPAASPGAAAAAITASDVEVLLPAGR